MAKKPLTVEERIDAIDAESVAKKQEQLRLRDERRALLAERHRLIFTKRIRDELGGSANMKAAVAAGIVTLPGPDDLTLQEAADMLAEARKTKRPGDVVVTPAPGELGTAPGTPSVDGGDA